MGLRKLVLIEPEDFKASSVVVFKVDTSLETWCANSSSIHYLRTLKVR